MFSTHSTKAFWSRLHYSFSRPSLCLHLYFITCLQDLNVSELSLTSLPMQGSCSFLRCHFHIPSALFHPASLFWLPPLFPSLGTSQTPFLTLSSTSHTLCFFFLFLSLRSLTKMSLLSLRLVSATLFSSLTLRGWGGCSPPLYANNVPVLREEAA